MFQDCECCGTGIAIGYRVEKGIAYYRPNGRIVLPWELRDMSESEKATLRAEERTARIPVAYPDQVCPHCGAGKQRAERMLGREVTDPEDEWRGKDRLKRRP